MLLASQRFLSGTPNYLGVCYWIEWWYIEYWKSAGSRKMCLIPFTGKEFGLTKI